MGIILFRFYRWWFLVRALTSSEIVVSSTQSVGEIIRLRDVWDASLKKMLDMIQK